MANQFSYISVLAPFLLEDRVDELVNNPARILDYRLTEELSEALVKQTCSFIFEGMPLTKLSDGSAGGGITKSYDNFVLPKEIPTDPRTRLLVPHKWTTSAYQSIYSELVLENSFPLSDEEQIVVYCSTINSNYIKVLGTSIIGYSPLLEKQIFDWKIANNNKNPVTSDLFGTDNFRAELIEFAKKPTSAKLKSLNQSIPGTNINLTTSKVVNPYATSEVQYFALYPHDSVLIAPEIGILQEDFQLAISKEGGSSSKVTNTGSEQIEVSVTRAPLEGPISGLANPNWTVHVTFPLGVLRSVSVSSAGVWTCDYPAASYTQEEIDTITVRQQDTTTTTTTENTTAAIVQKSYGLPVLDFKPGANGAILNNFYSNSLRNVAQLNSKFSYSKGGECYKYVFKKSTSPFVLSGMYVGRPIVTSRTITDKFLSWPGSIVQSTGIDIMLYYDKEVLGTETPVFKDLINRSSTVASVSVGSVPYQNNIINLSTSWITERMEQYISTLKIPYEASYDATTKLLKVRYEKDFEDRFYTDKIGFSWESDLVMTVREQLRIRYEVMLPEDRLHRDFLSVAWDKEQTQGYKNILQTTWIKEKTFIQTQEVEFSWETVLVDRVIVKPFYVRLWDREKLIFNDCISFNVYGDSAKMQQYILNGELRYLFTNPPKFELVMFDYNLNPYSNVFLSTLEDPLFSQDYEDIPDRYDMIGNYTIKDVNLNNSFSLDVIAAETQLNEYRSYWVPDNIEDYKAAFITMADGKSTMLPLEDMFRDEHHEDIVELDLIILDKNECCFTQSSVGSRCSPY